MSRLYRIVKDGITNNGCPIYRIDERKLFYWSIGAFEFAPDYRCYSLEEAINKIRTAHPNARIYYQIPFSHE